MLPGLKLAAYDEARGTISRQRAADMTRSILAIIGELEEPADATLRGTSNQGRVDGTAAGPVACVAGRGQFDDVVSAMLAQLLAHRGVASRRIAHASVSRETIAELDLSGIKVIAACCLELAGAPAHVRYLIRRLRHRAPDATVIAGLWPQGEVVLHDPQVQKALGGDRFVASLREALHASLAALSDAPVPSVLSTDTRT